MSAKALQRKNLLLPHFVVYFARFLFGYQALRLFDRLKIVSAALLRWLAVFYVPVYIWLMGNLVKYFWGWSQESSGEVWPYFWGWLPLPFFYPNEGDFASWLLCHLVGLMWACASMVLLNQIVQRKVAFERIEEKWRRACLHVGLVTNTNLQPLEDVKEYPHVVSVSPVAFIIKAKGFTPEIIQEKRTELASAMGLFLGNVEFLKKPDGSTYADLLEIGYARRDLPALLPLRNTPVARPGEVTMGMSMQGWQSLSLEGAVHLGVAGEPGSGKSVFLRSIITQLLCTDRAAVIIGLDFKGGAEFAFFEELGNFICVDEYESAAKVLALAFEEYKRRVSLVRASACDSIAQLRASAKVQAPPLVIIIDEAGEFWDSEKGVAKALLTETYGYVDKLARLGRFAGIHLIVCTQRASADAIPPRVRSMLTTRVIFKVSQKEDSIMFIGTAAATKLRKIPGRFYLRAPDGNLKEMQAPYVSKTEAKALVAARPSVESALMASLRQSVWTYRNAA